MPTDFDKAKQEQETRRKLWRRQQKARIQRNLPENLSMNTQKNEQERNNSGNAQEPSNPRSFRAITSRLRKQKFEELKEKKGIKGGVKGKIGEADKKIKEAKKKIEETKEAIKKLKNIYRIINGASAATLVGIIITFLIMNAQLILGNGLKLKIFPKLSFPEIIIVLFVDFVIFMLLIALVWSISLIIAISSQNPAVKAFI